MLSKNIRRGLSLAGIIVLFVWLSFFQQLLFNRYDPWVRCVLAIILALQIRGLREAREIFDFRLDWPIWLFLVCLLAGIVNATNKEIAGERYVYLAVTFLLLFYIGKCLYIDEKNIRVICLTICFCSSLVVVIGLAELYFAKNIIYEQFITNPFYARYIAAVPPVGLERYVRYAPRPMSTLFMPVILGSYLLGCLPFSFYFFKDKSFYLRVLGIWTSILCLVMIILSLSRGVFLGLVALLVFYLWHRRRRKAVAILLSGLILFTLAGPFFPHGKLSRFGLDEMVRGRYDSVISEYRFNRIVMTGKIVRDYPLFGIGFDHFRIRFNQYCDQKDLGTVPDEFMIPDNMYLTFLAETGLVGTAGFMVLIFSLFRKGIRRINKIADTAKCLPLLIAISAAVGLLVNMAAYELFYWHSPYMIFCLICGFMQYGNNLNNQKNYFGS